jgi:hypothetical protein
LEDPPLLRQLLADRDNHGKTVKTVQTVSGFRQKSIVNVPTFPWNLGTFVFNLELETWNGFLFPEHEEYSPCHQGEGDKVVPSELFLEIQNGEHGEDDEGYDLLDDLQLRRGEMVMADAVCGDLEAVFGKGDEPAHKYHLPQGRVLVSQMPVPGKGHEHVGNGQKHDCLHFFLPDDAAAVIYKNQELVGRKNTSRFRLKKSNDCATIDTQESNKTSPEHT